MWTIDKDKWDGCDGRTNYIVLSDGRRIDAGKSLLNVETIVAEHNKEMRCAERLSAMNSLLGSRLFCD